MGVQHARFIESRTSLGAIPTKLVVVTRRSKKFSDNYAHMVGSVLTLALVTAKNRIYQSVHYLLNSISRRAELVEVQRLVFGKLEEKLLAVSS